MDRKQILSEIQIVQMEPSVRLLHGRNKRMKKRVYSRSGLTPKRMQRNPASIERYEVHVYVSIYADALNIVGPLPTCYICSNPGLLDVVACPVKTIFSVHSLENQITELVSPNIENIKSGVWRASVSKSGFDLSCRGIGA